MYCKTLTTFAFSSWFKKKHRKVILADSLDRFQLLYMYVCSTCRLRPLWKSAVFRAGNVVSDVGCHIFPLKLQIAESGTRSCAFSHWDSGAQWGQNNFGITFLYFSITFVWHLSVDFWGQGSTGSRLCLKISFWRKFFFIWLSLTFKGIMGTTQKTKGFGK